MPADRGVGKSRHGVIDPSRMTERNDKCNLENLEIGPPVSGQAYARSTRYRWSKQRLQPVGSSKPH